MTETFRPLDLLQSITKKWWITAISMVIGGIGALILTEFIPPLYESSASFSVTIDYTKTGALSDVQEDQAMRGIGYVITSDDAIENVVNEVMTISAFYSRDQFEKESFLDREEFLWTLRYRSSDPIFARDVVQAWVERSNTLIQDGLIHAQIVDSETKILWGLENCLELATGQESIDTLCGFASIKELVDEIANISSLIHEEKMAARGLFSPLAVQIVNQPQVPVVPVRHQRNLFVFAGIMSGLLISNLLQVILNKRSFEFDK
ncbi:MAG: hypothetical protein Q7J07_06870 [Pelolinea sp.]|nr:hypothetical protein [Pelolinea sp.]